MKVQLVEDLRRNALWITTVGLQAGNGLVWPAKGLFLWACQKNISHGAGLGLEGQGQGQGALKRVAVEKVSRAVWFERTGREAVDLEYLVDDHRFADPRVRLRCIHCDGTFLAADVAVDGLLVCPHGDCNGWSADFFLV